MTHKLKRIQLQNEIVYSKQMEHVNFPRTEKKTIKITTWDVLPSDDEIISKIEKAREDAIISLNKMKINFEITDLECPIELSEESVDDLVEEADLEDERDYIDKEWTQNTDEVVVEDSVYNEEICSDMDELQADLQTLSGVTGELQLKNYDAKRNLSETSAFATVTCQSGKNVVVRKSSIVWLLSNTKSNLSSDRLVRVQESEFGVKKRFHMENATTMASEIFIGEWCIFSTENKIVLGLVLNFLYIKGTGRKKQYSLDYAPVQFITKDETEARGIGVVATWYTWDDSGALENAEMASDFINIENYKMTFRRSPKFESGRLIFHEDQFDEIKKIRIGNIINNKNM